MSMTDGAAPAAAESTPAPAGAVIDSGNGDEVARAPNPVDHQPQAQPEEEGREKPAATEKPAKKDTARDAIDRALAKVEARANATEGEAKPGADKKVQPGKAEVVEKPAEVKRGEHGHFAKKDGEEQSKPTGDQAQPVQRPTAFKDAPTRFSADAKGAWEQTPEPVRAEAHRMLREFEQGFEKHRQSAQQWDDLKDFHELATKNNTTVKQVLSNYVGLVSLARQQPIVALERIVGNLGLKRADGSPVTLRDIAGFVLNQKPDEVATRQDGIISTLNQKIAQLEKQLSGVTNHLDRQNTDAVDRELAAFAAEPGHERLEELAVDMNMFMVSGKAKTLSEAYELAERLNPAPARASNPEPLTPAKQPDPDEDPQKVNKGQLSVRGAPSSGSSPPRGKPSTSVRASVDRAFARIG